MSIENDLKRIADALEIIATRLSPIVMDPAGPGVAVDIKPGTPAPAPAKKKAVVDAVPAIETAVTKEQLADALRSCVMKIGPVKTKEILATFNASKLSEIKPEDASRACATLMEKANG